MIDNYSKAMALVEKMKTALPIPVRPSQQLVDLLRQRGVTLDVDTVLRIRSVLYTGDEGGISCDVTPAGSKELDGLLSQQPIDMSTNPCYNRRSQSLNSDHIHVCDRSCTQPGPAKIYCSGCWPSALCTATS